MNKHTSRIAGLCLIAMVLAGCGGEASTPVAQVDTEAPPVTSTATVTPDPCPHQVIAVAYQDLNQNGQRDPGENPLPGLDFGMLRRDVPADKALIAYGETGPDGLVTLAGDSGECIPPDAQVSMIAFPPGYTTFGRNARTAGEYAASGQPLEFGITITEATPRPTPTAITPLGDAAPEIAAFAPCDLLTETEVEDATGITVPQTPEAYIGRALGGDGDSYVCNYSPAANVTTIIAAPTDDIGTLLEALIYGDTETVPGIGEQASWVIASGALVVRHRNVLIEIQPQGGGKTTATRLARIALARLDDLLDHPDRPTPTPTPEIEACDVLTVAQAEDILGKLTREPELGSAIGESVGEVFWCTYHGADATATVAFTRYRSAALAGEAFNNQRPPEGIAPGDVVEGIGDEAVVGPEQYSLLILRGTVTIQISMDDGDPGLVRDLAIAIGKIVVDSIP